MIYIMATATVAPQNLDKFLKTFKEEWHWEKYGRKLAGQWITTLGQTCPREITDLWAFEDLTHRQRETEQIAKDPEISGVMAKLNSMLVTETIKVMRPLPLSPLQ